MKQITVIFINPLKADTAHFIIAFINSYSIKRLMTESNFKATCALYFFKLHEKFMDCLQHIRRSEGIVFAFFKTFVSGWEIYWNKWHSIERNNTIQHLCNTCKRITMTLFHFHCRIQGAYVTILLFTLRLSKNLLSFVEHTSSCLA